MEERTKGIMAEKKGVPKRDICSTILNCSDQDCHFNNSSLEYGNNGCNSYFSFKSLKEPLGRQELSFLIL